MNRITGLAAALLSVLLLAATAVVAVLTWVSLDLDLTPYKTRVVNELYARTGLRVEVTGTLTLRLGPELELKAEGLTLTNPAVGDAPLLRAQAASFTAETLPLLRGRLEARDLDLTGARVDLTRNRAGRPNWGLSAPVAGLEDLRLRVKSSQVVYTDRPSGQVLRIGVRALEASRTGEVLKLALDGDIDGEPIRVTGHTAPLERILTGDAVIPIDLRGELLGLDLRADGALALPGTPNQTRATLTLKARTLRGLSRWLGQDVAALGPVDARLVLDGGGGRYALAPLAVSIGPTRADGRVSVDLTGERPAVDLDLTLAELDLRPYQLEGETPLTPSQGRVFSEAPLSLDWMAAADVQARVRLNNLVSDRLALLDLDLTATLTDGSLRVTGTGKAQQDRALALSLGLDARGAEPRLDLELRGDKLRIGPLAAGTVVEGQVSGDLDARIKVQASGPSEAAMAASLAGDLLLLAQGIEAPVQGLDRLGGGVRAVVGQIVTPRSTTARIECGLVVLTFKAGRTDIKGVIDTPNSTVSGEGRLDLAQETIELRLVPQPKGVAVLSVAAPVLVSGRLTAPDYRIEPGALLTSLSDLAARIAVPQLLLVDAFGPAVTASSCGQILAGKNPSGAEYGLLGGASDAAGAVLGAPGTLVKGVGGLVKDAGGAVIEGTSGLLKGVGGIIKGAGEAVKESIRPEPNPETDPRSEP